MFLIIWQAVDFCVIFYCPEDAVFQCPPFVNAFQVGIFLLGHRVVIAAAQEVQRAAVVPAN